MMTPPNVDETGARPASLRPAISQPPASRSGFGRGLLGKRYVKRRNQSRMIVAEYQLTAMQGRDRGDDAEAEADAVGAAAEIPPVEALGCPRSLGVDHAGAAVRHRDRDPSVRRTGCQAE